MKSFKAYMIEVNNNKIETSLKRITLNDLPDSEVLIKVAYSSINYKDALATVKNSGVIKSYPMIPGIDLSGVVVFSKIAKFKAGDLVFITGYGLGVSHFGGFAKYACVSSDWIIKLPKNTTLKDIMVLGTAGLTAALSIYHLEQNGMNVDNQPEILVTGATGGVGSITIMLLKAFGYHNITAVSRKVDYYEYLLKLGSSKVISPESIIKDNLKPLEKQLYDYIIDPVGGKQLSAIIAQTKYNGAVALSGNVGGIGFETTVLPFILRGVKLLGIDSVMCPYDLRIDLWNRVSSSFAKLDLNLLVNCEISLDEIDDVINKLLEGKHHGRTIINNNISKEF